MAVCSEVKKCGQKQVNDRVACACVESICNAINPNWEVVTNCANWQVLVTGNKTNHSLRATGATELYLVGCQKKS